MTDSSRRLELVQSTPAVVVKVGSRVLTHSSGGIQRERIAELASQLCQIADSRRHVVLVSSGAVAAGIGKLGLDRRPEGLARLQAVAAIGQTELIEMYENEFTKHGRHAAQILLTASDLRRRSGYLNVRNALIQLHQLGAIPVVNENDSVAVEELATTFGDNDRLAASVASLLPNALLIILSDVEGLYDRAPTDPAAILIGQIDRIDRSVLDHARDSKSGLSKGGMASKLRAARVANSHGHPVIIAPGRQPNVITDVLAGKPIGTLFLPRPKPLRGRRRWIGQWAEVAGRIQLDGGAVRAITEKGRSLLAIGILGTDGEFPRGSIVSLVDPDGNEIARGLSNYSSADVARIRGLQSDKIESVLGHQPYVEVIHRDNMTVH